MMENLPRTVAGYSPLVGEDQRFRQVDDKTPICFICGEPDGDEVFLVISREDIVGNPYYPITMRDIIKFPNVRHRVISLAQAAGEHELVNEVNRFVEGYQTGKQRC